MPCKLFRELVVLEVQAVHASAPTYFTYFVMCFLKIDFCGTTAPAIDKA